MKQKTNKQELHEKCNCKDCQWKNELTKSVLDSWVQLEAGRIAREIIYPIPKHKHIFKQKNFFNGTTLHCNCGMVLKWNVMEQQYEEEK